MSKAHAFLSASAAHRWIACPPSAKLQEMYEDKGSEYAAQGTDAHTLAEWKALKLIGVDQPDPRENLTWYDQEMEEATDAYAQYIAETIAEAKKTCSDPCVMIEQRVDFSRWVPDGFGTADAIVVGSGHLWITVLKFGTGVEVLAENNPQASCYALGCIELLDDLYGIDTVTMQIFQPRRSHVSEWTVSKDELLKWAEEILRPAAKLAAAGKGKFCPGDHCRFCKARHECRARADAQLKLMRYDFELPPTLTDEEIEDILGQADHLIAWAEDIKAYALESAIGGKHWNGYKLVEGRSIRRYTDEEAVARAVQADGKDHYEKKLLGITDMTRLLGRKHFDEVLGGLIEKPRGKATLVPESDKRPAMDFSDFTNDEENEGDTCDMEEKTVGPDWDYGALRTAIEIAPTVQTFGGWLSVKDRLPEKLEPVNIVWVNRKPERYYAAIKDKPFVATGYYWNDKWWWYSATCEDYLAEYGRSDCDEIDLPIEITHWMPLPEPPKEDKDDA